MSDTREIFSLRKQGQIDAALTMARDYYELNKNDDWAVKAYAWCLYDKIKAFIAVNNYAEAKRLSMALAVLPINEDDDILFTSVQRTLLNVDPNRKLLRDAKSKSEEGNHAEALRIYLEAKNHFPNDKAIDESIAWEIYKLKKNIFDQKPINILEAKKILAEYIRLNNPRPSIIHSSFLRLGDKIIDGDSFNSIQFLKIWDLKNLRAEDFEPNVFEGKSYPSLAEKVIQHSAKAIIEKKLNSEVDYFLPFLEMGIKKFRDNIWLSYYKVKFLQLTGKNNEALKFIVPIAKLKSDEFWTWGLLGELYFDSDKKKSLSCFCKALLCKAEQKFLGNTRIRLAQLLIDIEKPAEAKYEIDNAIKARLDEGYKVSTLLTNYAQQEWYLKTKSTDTNIDFYRSNKRIAEEILFEDLPWIKANLGEQYTLPDKPDKPRRKLYVSFAENQVEEISTNAIKIKSLKNKTIGVSLRIKAEKDKDGRTKIYLIEPRDSECTFDVLSRYDGNITKIKRNDKNEIEAINFLFVDGEKSIEWNTKKINLFDRNKLTVGEPVRIAISLKKKEEKDKVYSFRTVIKNVYDVHEVQYRSEGFLFDTIPDKIGVVDHINTEKGIAHFIVNKKVEGIVKSGICKEEIKVGDIISIKIIEIKGEKGAYFQALTCKKTDQEPESGVVKRFSGQFEGNDNFGFADDVYIPKHLIESSRIQPGDLISGTAIISYNKKRSQWGFTAISM